MSGPICLMSLYGITIFGSQRRNPSHWFPPGTMILQMHPLHSSNSRSQTCPSFLQSLTLITSLHFNSEKNIGELVMNKLKDLDAVAYVRFASVYREFKDVNTFMDELKSVLNDKNPM